MLRNFFISRPVLAITISLIMILCGLVALLHLPVAQFPNIAPPTISISASYPGANAETGAKVVAAQIENQLNGVSDLMYLQTATTSTGAISITLYYNIGADTNYAINEVLNRLQSAMRLLPKVVQQQGVVARKTSPDMLAMVSFYADPYIDSKWVSEYLQRTVKNDLLLLSSVGTVNILGTGSYAINIWLDPNKMAKYSVTVDDLQTVINDQNREYVIGRTNAVPNVAESHLTLSIIGQAMYSTPKQFENIIIRNKGNQVVKIKDVARVELGSNNYNTIAQVNFRNESGKFFNYPCALMMIYTVPNANQLESIKQVMNKIKEDSQRFPVGLQYKLTLDNSKFVSASVKNVDDTLEIAIMLVGIVIFLFLRNWRASIIAIISIPVSVIGTMACLYLLHFSLNTLSLFAMVLAIGIVVDDAIVIVENIERLRIEHPEWSLRLVIEETMREVFGAVIAIVLVLSVVFIPVMVLGGLAGIMYRQFAVTISCAVVLSGICALTFTPAISYLLLKSNTHPPKKSSWFNRLIDQLTTIYVSIASHLIYHKKTALIFWFTILIAMGGMFKSISRGFIPNEDLGLVFGTINLASSSNLAQTKIKVDEMVKKLTKNPYIDTITSVTGFDFLDFSSQKTYAATLFIILKDWSQRTSPDSSSDHVIEQINALQKNEPGITIQAFKQPPMRGLNTTGGVEFFVEDLITGDPKKLQKIVDEFINRLKQHKEIAGGFQTLNTNVPVMSIIPDIDRAKFFGVNLNSVYNSIQAMYSNFYVNYAYIMQDLVWVIIEADYRFRATIQNLSNVFVHSSITNEMIPINSMVQVSTSRNAQVIQRFNDYFASKVTLTPAPGYSMGDVMNVVTRESSSLPQGYSYEWFGTSYQQQQSKSTSKLAFGFSLIMIYLVLAALYKMWRLPLVVLLGIPCALFGSAVFLLLSGKTNDLYFQISLITLLGLSAKNIILLTEFALQNYKNGMGVEQSAIYALQLRFRPIVMTSVTFILGALPLVFARGAGANAQHSVGLGIIGGILGSVLIGTLLTPALFVMFMKNKKISCDEDH